MVSFHCQLLEVTEIFFEAYLHIFPEFCHLKCYCFGTSLVVQWLGVCLPIQGTRVRALVWEDPTCHGAAKPMCHKYWACALEPMSHNCWARVPQLLKPMHLEPPCSTGEATAMRSLCTTMKSNPRSLQQEKVRAQLRRPNAAKNKLNK